MQHDKEMFHGESWKPIYSVVKRSKIKVASHKKIAGVGLAFLSAGFFQLTTGCRPNGT